MGKKEKEKKESEEEKEEADKEESVEDKLKESLEEINTYQGVIGYILRNSTSATVEIKDPTKIIDYAILSSSALNASEVLSQDFQVGKTKNILVEGKDGKVLSLTVDGNRASVFMEKEGDCRKVLKKIK